MARDKTDAARAEQATGLPGAHAERARKENPDMAAPNHRARRGRVVSDVMLTEFEVCNPDTEVDYIAKMMVDENCTMIPVVDDTETMHPVGVVTAKDIVHRIVARGEIPAERHARDCMSDQPVCVKTDMTLQDAAEVLTNRDVRRALVLDEKDRLCGVFLGDQR